MSKPDYPLMAPTGESFIGDERIALRDYFAAAALAGLTSDPSLLTAAQITGPEGIAVSAYQIADAMIREREK
jgi:hypothetical protein